MKKNSGLRMMKMKVGNKVTIGTEIWTITKIWPDGDVSLIDDGGYRIDVTMEYFEHHCKFASEEE